MARVTSNEGNFVERRIQRIANARSVTIGLALTFVGAAALGGFVIRLVDSETFHSTGLGMWWALQTVTTVGYGDIVPHGTAGKLVGAVEMVLGVSFLTFVTAGVTSTVVQRGERTERDADRAKLEEHVGTIIEALASVEKRLESLESKLADRPS